MAREVLQAGVSKVRGQLMHVPEKKLASVVVVEKKPGPVRISLRHGIFQGDILDAKPTFRHSRCKRKISGV